MTLSRRREAKPRTKLRGSEKIASRIHGTAWAKRIMVDCASLGKGARGRRGRAGTAVSGCHMIDALSRRAVISF